MWLGFCTDEVLPSPKSHDQVLTVPSLSVEVSEKLQSRSVQAKVNDAVGAWLPTGVSTIS